MARQTHTRDRLVRAAAELFWRKGYAHTGVSEIMKRAKATSGSFYHFFPTKDDLLLTVLGAVRQRVEDEVLALAESTAPDPLGRLSALAQAYRVQTVPDSVEFGLPIGALINELGSGHDDARRHIGEIYEIVVGRVSMWFAGPGGPPAGAAERRNMAELVVAALEGAALLAAASRSVEPIDVCVELLVLQIGDILGTGERADDLPPPSTADGSAGDWKAW